MDALAHTRWMKASLLVLVVPAITASFVNAWGNYQQEEFEKMLKGKAPTRKGEVKITENSEVLPTSELFINKAGHRGARSLDK